MSKSLKIGFFDYQNVIIDGNIGDLSELSSFKIFICHLLDIKPENSLQFYYQQSESATPQIIDQKSFFLLQTNFFIWIMNEKIVDQLQKEAYSENDINSSFWLALFLFSGKNTKQNRSESAYLFRKAADSGNRSAQLFTYICFSQGLGVPTNSIIAQHYFELASNLTQHMHIKNSSQVQSLTSNISPLNRSDSIVIQEFKSSQTAPLTNNQKIAFPEIFESGGTVVGKGKGVFTGGYNIPKGTRVRIIRP